MGQVVKPQRPQLRNAMMSPSRYSRAARRPFGNAIAPSMRRSIRRRGDPGEEPAIIVRQKACSCRPPLALGRPGAGTLHPAGPSATPMTMTVSTMRSMTSVIASKDQRIVRGHGCSALR